MKADVQSSTSNRPRCGDRRADVSSAPCKTCRGQGPTLKSNFKSGVVILVVADGKHQHSLQRLSHSRIPLATRVPVTGVKKMPASRPDLCSWLSALAPQSVTLDRSGNSRKQLAPESFTASVSIGHVCGDMSHNRALELGEQRRLAEHKRGTLEPRSLSGVSSRLGPLAHHEILCRSAESPFRAEFGGPTSICFWKDEDVASRLHLTMYSIPHNIHGGWPCLTRVALRQRWSR
jgi:hypothetical protein